MRKPGLVAIAMALLTALAVPQQSIGQRPKDAVKALKASIVGQRFFLQGFSADADVVWQWDQNKLVMQPAEAHAIVEFTPRALTLQSDVVEISGSRRLFVRGESGYLEPSTVVGDIAIHVDLRGSNLVNEIALLPDLIFIKVQSYNDLRFPLDYPDRRRGRSLTLDCSQQDPDSTTANAALHFSHMIPPKVVSAAEPRLSEEARKKRIGGNVLVTFMVDTQGIPENLWIVRPMGFGLDEEAARAAMKYRFTPATCHGVPVAASISVDVNFQIF